MKIATIHNDDMLDGFGGLYRKVERAGKAST